MGNEREISEGSRPQLGGTSEGRIQRYFCVDDGEGHAFSRVSKEARVIRREPRKIRVLGKEVNGWIVEVMVPATDGTVREDPMESDEKI